MLTLMLRVAGIGYKEKEPFTANRMNEFASSGTYFFKSSRRMFEAMHELFERNLSINGEYYVSLVYKILLENGEKVSVFPPTFHAMGHARRLTGVLLVV